MAEIHIKEHASPIKTPKQLIIVVVLSFVIPIALIVLLTQLVVRSSDYSRDSGMSEEAIAQRLQPVGDLAIGDPGPDVVAAAPVEKAPADPTPKAEITADTGEAIYKKTCTVCHGPGIAGAPKSGDRAAWGDRLKKDREDLYANSIKGIGAMPPRGGNPKLSDAQVKAAVDYMLKQVQ
jgi:cytochrome c5